MRTPGHDEELIHGFLYAEGIIQSAADITAIDLSGSNPQAGPTRARVRLRGGLDASAKLFLAIPYDTPRGCAAAYYPEANVLVPIHARAETSQTPTSKSIVVTLRASSEINCGTSTPSPPPVPATSKSSTRRTSS